MVTVTVIMLGEGSSKYGCTSTCENHTSHSARFSAHFARAVQVEKGICTTCKISICHSLRFSSPLLELYTSTGVHVDRGTRGLGYTWTWIAWIDRTFESGVKIFAGLAWPLGSALLLRFIVLDACWRRLYHCQRKRQVCAVFHVHPNGPRVEWPARCSLGKDYAQA